MKVTGGNSLVKRLQAAQGKLDNAIMQGVHEAAKIGASEISKLCPVDSGKLRASIDALNPVATKNGAVCEVSIEGGHEPQEPAVDIEFGSAHQPASPFIRPGFRIATDKATQAITDKIVSTLPR